MESKRLQFPQIKQVIWEPYTLPTTLEPHAILIKTSTSLISVGTELAIYTGSHIGFSLPTPPFQLIPHTPGYALMGQVLQVGQAVTTVQPNQRLMLHAPHGTHAIADVRYTPMTLLPDSLTDAEGPLIRLAEVALTALRVAPVQVGDTVLIYGLGLVGQFVAQLYQLNGAHPVIAVDRIPHRLAIAQANGIIALNADTVDVASHVNALTQGRGPDVVVEATGNPMVLPLALDLVTKGGRVVLLGSSRGRVELDPYSQIHRKGIRLIGAHETAQSLDFTPQRWSQARNLRLLADLLAAGKLNSHNLISHTIKPDEALSIYDSIAQQPQAYLGVLIDWSN